MMVITVRGTIMDGPVVSWFSNEDAAKDWRAALVTASRNGVHIDCWLHDLPEGALEQLLLQARDAQAWARSGVDAAAMRLRFATHVDRPRSGLVPLHPVGDRESS